MSKILLTTTCELLPDYSFNKKDTYYDTDEREAQNSPIAEETTNVLACKTYQAPAGMALETYCTVVNNAGVLRTVTASGNPVFLYNNVDKPDASCPITDLAITSQAAFNTSSANASDGKIFIDATTSHPPIRCFITPLLGEPTSYQVFNAGGTVVTYHFIYENVPAGNYAAQVEDASNGKKNSKVLVVGKGTIAIDPAITWFKYKYKNNPGYTPQITGYAWNKQTKQGYSVAVNINYLLWQEYTTEYKTGARVIWDWHGDYRIFEAARDILADPKNGKVPTPSDDSIRDGNWKLVPDGYHYDINGTRYTINEFNTQLNSTTNYTAYPQGSIITYRYNNFYKAKVNLDGRNYYGRTLPFPAVGTSNQYWEYLPDFTEFSYLVAESATVDSYVYGSKIRTVSYYAKNPANPTFIPAGSEVRAAADAGDYIIFNDTEPAKEITAGDLEIIDIIENDIDEEGSETGSVWIQATSPSLPLKFHLVNGVRPGYVQDNETGIYENLHPGHYEFQVTDAANRSVTAKFEISDKYRLRWRLKYDDLKATPLEIRIFQQDWKDGVTEVVGTEEPAVLSWDSAASPDAYLPQAVGAVLEFNLYTQVAQQFLDTIKADDRRHRVDFYRANKLEFRGYIDATSYTEALISDSNKIQLAATCGLGQLRDTYFINHLNERQLARTNMLSILLKCLTFTDINLPIYCGINLRDKLMSANGEPLAEAFINRSIFSKKEEKVIEYTDFPVCRDVVDNILRLFNAMLFQAKGAWHIISLTEVHNPAVQVRKFSAAGTLLSAGATNAPVLTILPVAQATAPNSLFWINKSQTVTYVAEAKLSRANVTFRLAENLLENGNFVQWIDMVRPANWQLVGALKTKKVAGEKAKEFAVQFSDYSNNYTAASYLLSPPAPHLSGQEEEFMKLKMRVCVDALTTNPTPSTLTLSIQVEADGIPQLANPLAIKLSSADKWKDVDNVYLPLGLPGKQIRVRIMPPVLDAGSPPSSLRLNSIALSIQPGQDDWSNLEQDFEETENDKSVTTGIILEPVELVVADIPQLSDAAGNPLKNKGMDVYAWQHGISTEDYKATGNWYRPSELETHTLLYTAAQDRLEMRYTPTPVVTGEVAGAGINLIREGLMLDMPTDLTGKYVIISCFIYTRKGTATITCRKLADDDYSTPADLPDDVRVAKVNNILGYRIATDEKGDEGYRIAFK